MENPSFANTNLPGPTPEVVEKAAPKQGAGRQEKKSPVPKTAAATAKRSGKGIRARRAATKAELNQKRKADTGGEDKPGHLRLQSAWGASPVNGQFLVYDVAREDDPDAYRLVSAEQIEEFRVLRKGDPHFSIPKGEFESLPRPHDFSGTLKKLMPTLDDIQINLWRNSRVVGLDYPVAQHANNVTRISRAIQSALPGGDDILTEAQAAE